MKLYYAPGACSLAAHITAREARVPVDLVRVDLKAHRTQSGADYYGVNPRGYVPAIQLDDGTLLTEVAALVQFLADKTPAAGLLPPTGSMDRLHVQEWLTYIGTELHKTFAWLFHPLPEEMKKIVRDKVAKRFAELDRHLSSRQYLFGDRFSVADAYAFTIVNWSNFLAFDLKPYLHLSTFMARVAARPKVQEALKAEGLLQ